MPRGDGTGPMGMGSMTGRGAGYCAGAGQVGFGRVGFGRGQGLGRRCTTAWGMGGGYRRGLGFGGNMAGSAQQATPETEKQLLQNQATALQAQLEQIQKRIAAMNADPEASGTP
nr:DUF5320 domain-containing protein [uncultured Desulfobulbus sp.]